MKPHRSMLSRIWSKYFPKAEGSHARPAEPVRPTRMDGSAQENTRSPRSPRSGIEMLEGRIAPAILLNPTTLIYTDVDGDLVTVKFSKALFKQSGDELLTTLNNVFKFDTGTIAIAGTPEAENPSALAPQQLQKIDLTAVPLVGAGVNQVSPAAGVSITVTAKRADTLTGNPGEQVVGKDGILDGDDLANVGAIVASTTSNSFNLGKVTIDGDLGQIDAGNSKYAVGVASLKVHSLGVATGTQMSGGNLESTILGSLGSLTVTTDVKGAYINVISGSGSGNKAIGKIGNVTIGGTLEGLDAENSGTIRSATSIGKIKIGSGEIVDPPETSGGENNENTPETAAGVTDGIKGGAGKNSGAIIAATTIASITINGDIQGSTGESSGSIKAGSNIGAIVVGTGAEGHGILGSSGASTGAIHAGGKIASIQLKGDLLGGVGTGNSDSTAAGSGSITANGAIGKVRIDGTIGTFSDTETLFAGANSGRIYSKVSIGKVMVKSIEGGSALGSGVIQSDGTLGVVTVNESVIGGGAAAGGIVAKGKLAGVIIKGNLEGGLGMFSGFVQGESQIGFVRVLGDVKGHESSTEEKNGFILSAGSLGEVTIGGSLIGGKGDYSGFIQAAGDGTGSLGKVTIGKQLRGGEGHSSGAITSGAKIGTVVINNSEKLETAVEGGDGSFSGAISAGTTISAITIKGDVKGGDGDYSASIQSYGLLAKLTISGDLLGGKGDWSGSIASLDSWYSEIAGDLGKLSISGVLKAGEGAFSGLIYADGNLKSLTLGSIDIGTFDSEGPGAGDGSASVIAGAGFYNPGNVGSITVTGSMQGGGDNHALLEIYGSLNSLSVRDGIADGDIHIGGNLGKLTVGTAGKKGIVADIENVTLTAGSTPPASAKLATAIASITVSGDVSNSQILAGYNVDGEATNASARIGNVKVSGDWIASDLVAGIKAVNGYFGDGNDEVADDGTPNLTSRIANVLIGGSVVGSDVESDHFGFVAQEIGKFKIGKTVITPNVQTGLPDDVSVRTIPVIL